MQGQHIPTDAQKDEAALWHVKRAGGSMSVAQEGEFDAWINADPGNRLAYDQMRVLWAQVEEPARRISTAMAGEKPRFDKVRQWFSPGRAFAGVAGAVAVGACVFFFNPDMVENIRADIVTENETVTDVTLTDGSIVHLAANSAIATDFADGRRDVELLRGQAFFEVTHRNGDRFRVHAGPAMIEVVGTRFMSITLAAIQKSLSKKVLSGFQAMATRKVSCWGQGTGWRSAQRHRWATLKRPTRQQFTAGCRGG